MSSGNEMSPSGISDPHGIERAQLERETLYILSIAISNLDALGAGIAAAHVMMARDLIHAKRVDVSASSQWHTSGAYEQILDRSQ